MRNEAARYFIIFAYTLIIYSCDNGAQNEHYGVIYTTKTPAIDGILDDCWHIANREKILKFKEVKSIPDSGDLSAEFSAMWDEDYLYIFCFVKDNKLYNLNALKYKSLDAPNSYECDAVELFIDSKNKKLNRFDANDENFKYEFIYGNDKITSLSGSPITGIEYAILETADGYCCEVAIPFRTLDINPSTNKKIGFEIAVDDNDNNPIADRFMLNRKTVNWSEEGITSLAYRNTSVYGVLNLINADK